MVFRLSLAAVAACFTFGVLATPIEYNTAKLLPRGPEGEPFQCPDPSGTAAAKQNLVNAGAQPIGTSHLPPSPFKSTYLLN